MKISILSSRQILSFPEKRSSPSKHDISYFFLFCSVGDLRHFGADPDPDPSSVILRMPKKNFSQFFSYVPTSITYPKANYLQA
jgi:hypothetical protein